MSIQASWLTKKWTIDRGGIVALNGLSLTKELDVEENETKDGKNPTNVKGYKPQSLTTTHKVSRSAGKDPRKEFDEWTELVGKRGGFHVEGRRIGPPALILDKVEINVNALTNRGDFLDAEITLTFSEDVNFIAAPASATELFIGDTATPENTPGYKPLGAGTVLSAYNVRPSASAAEAKMGG